MRVTDRESAALWRIYYAATVVFVALDYLLHINVRLAFLDAWPAARAAYYLLCFACLALIVLRPGWGLWIATLESLLALSLLIVTMGVRVLTVSEQLERGKSDVIMASEIANFLIVGGAAWLAWQRGMHEIRRSSR